MTITLRGTLGTAWAIGVAPTATSCVAIPGISCPGGVATFSFTFPVLPPWTPLALRAVAQRPDLSLSFTSAITIWVL